MEDYNAPFKMGELVDSLKKSHDTAVGPDDIHYQILKHLPECTLDTLLNIYNQIWDGGDFPTEWREAIIIPIQKPDQIIRLESAVREAFVKREHLVSVYFDLEKAYDTTWRYGVMKDLHEAGLRGRMPIFIAKFLINRKFSVRIGGTLSEIYDQEEGVPQGSILAVTLFSIKINSIMKCLGNGIDGSLYVDDFLICYQSKQMNTIERHLQLCLNKIQKWADENGFKFSQTKTVSMHFCNLRKLHHEPTLTLSGLAIPVVQEHKFLGVIFDNKLSFIPHIKYLKARCLEALNLLKVVSRFDWGADSIVLLRLYRALVRSKLDYGSIVYGSARTSYIGMLDTVHHQGIRLSLGAFRTSPVESLYVEANEESLYRRRERLPLQYAIKLSSTPNNPTFDTVFRPKYSEIFAIRPNAIPTFGLRIKDLIDEANINIETIRQATMPESPSWHLESPLIIYGLKTVKKVDTNPLVFQGLFNDVQDKYFDHQFLYTDGAKDDHKVGCAVVSNFNIVKRRLPGQASIYTAELCAILLALDVVNNSNKDKYVICVDSLSCLQAIEHQHIDHPLVLDVLEKYSVLVNKTIILLGTQSCGYTRK